MSSRHIDPEIRRVEPILPLFEQAHARASDPVQSHQAAASVSLTNLGRTKDGIIAILRKFGPLTDDQIAAHFLEMYGDKKASPSGLRSRRSWLVDHGMVIQCGMSKTKSNRNCGVWKAAK